MPYQDLLYNISLSPACSDIPPNIIPHSFPFASLRLQLPIINSTTRNLAGHRLALTLASFGGLGIVHKDLAPKEQVELASQFLRLSKDIGFSLSGFDLIASASALSQAGASIFNIDLYNGHSTVASAAVRDIKQSLPNSIIIAGNAVTLDGYKRLSDYGADAVRIGDGASRHFSKSGFWDNSSLAQLIAQCHAYGGADIIVDNNICSTSDFVKCLALGASAVMLDMNGTAESEGQTISVGGSLYRAHIKTDPLDLAHARSEQSVSLLPYSSTVEEQILPYRQALDNAISYLGLNASRDLIGHLA